MPALGGVRVDEITADTLVDWFEEHAKAREWSAETGFRYLSTIAEVLKVGRRYFGGRALPTVEARERMSEGRRTARGRARRGDRRPLRDPAAIDRLLEAAAAEGLEARALVLCLLDTGVRRGEALALRWGSIAWGLDEDDRRRTCS